MLISKAKTGAHASGAPAAADASSAGVRPIAMGEALWKTGVVYLRHAIDSQLLALAGEGVQFGVALSGGCETAVLKLQSALDSSAENVAILTDVSNAFNTRERADIATALYENARAAPLWRAFRFSYGHGASPLLVYGAKGKEGRKEGRNLAEDEA